MTIVMGLDQHRAQITAEWIDTDTGEISRTRVAPADRQAVRRFQNPFAVALLGDQTGFNGPSRSIVYRWFTDPNERRIYPESDHPYHSRVYVAGLRSRLAKSSHDDSSMIELIDQLRLGSEEFTSLWNEHEVAVRTTDRKRMVHPMIGNLELDCQTLIAESQAQVLLVYTATPGTEDYDKLHLLSMIGTQQFKAPSQKTADYRH